MSTENLNWRKTGKSFSWNGFTVCTNEKQVFCGYAVKANMFALERPFKKECRSRDDS